MELRDENEASTKQLLRIKLNNIFAVFFFSYFIQLCEENSLPDS